MIISIITSLFIQWFAHPYHVSVCDVEHDIETKALQITHHIFLDDLEQALRKKYNTTLDIVNPENIDDRDRQIENYVTENFVVEVNGKLKPGKYLGHEFEQDALYCYIEVEGVKKLKNISIKNSVLMEIFADQINLVHIKVDGKIKSLKLDKKNNTGQINYSN